MLGVIQICKLFYSAVIQRYSQPVFIKRYKFRVQKCNSLSSLNCRYLFIYFYLSLTVKKMKLRYNIFKYYKKHIYMYIVCILAASNFRLMHNAISNITNN